MTREELQEHRAAVRTVLARTGTSWQFSSQAMEEAGSQQGPPFAIVAANTVDRAVGRFWPVRRYPWGRCEALLTAHSDLPALRRLLLESGYWEVKANTEARYWKFRAQEYAERANPVPVRLPRSSQRMRTTSGTHPQPYPCSARPLCAKACVQLSLTHAGAVCRGLCVP